MSDIRNELRAQIFSSAKKSALIKQTTLFNVDVEIKSPSLAAVLAYQKSYEDDSTKAMAQMLIDFTYVPGEDVKVFETADMSSILELPFSSDFMDYIGEINELLGLGDNEETVGN